MPGMESSFSPTVHYAQLKQKEQGRSLAQIRGGGGGGGQCLLSKCQVVIPVLILGIIS